MLIAIYSLHGHTDNMLMKRDNDNRQGYEDSLRTHITIGCETIVAAVADLMNYDQQFFSEEEVSIVENAYEFALTTIHVLEGDTYQ